MILHLVVSYCKEVFIFPIPVFTFCDLGGAARAFADKDNGRTAIEFLSLFHNPG